ncbi:hypothetical protein [Marmoricola sp. URHB0036]|uniref:hypothetical protein n=1 Tax=Marmoricola sp. URHB0036 TaxID=1298863 RepID=UPI000426CA90|nr:hypothetical protein [Marmoricola sp. URHB0036]
MNKSKTARVAAFIGALGASAALIGAAVSGTGAYFQGTTDQAHITGTMGTIKIEGVGGLDVVFQKMLPGEAQSKTVEYRSTGANNEDVWLVFTNPSQLGSHDAQTGLNSLGTYGEVHIASNGVEKFGSANLNDNASSCPPGAGNPACNPLPEKIKLADNVQPDQHGVFSFSFKPSEKFKSNQGLPVLGLDYKLVATQHGIDPS